MHVCPSTATRQRADGIVTIDYDICIGCAYCDVACPYQARSRSRRHPLPIATPCRTKPSARTASHRGGTEVHLLLGPHRLRARKRPDAWKRSARHAGLRECLHRDALHFGNLDDPESNVSRLLREQAHFRMHEELTTEPGFYYLYGKIEQPEENDPPSGIDFGRYCTLRTRGVEPWHPAALGLEGWPATRLRRGRDRPAAVCALASLRNGSSFFR